MGDNIEETTHSSLITEVLHNMNVKFVKEGDIQHQIAITETLMLHLLVISLSARYVVNVDI